MGAGRPTSYTEDIVESAIEYLSLCQDEEVTREKKDGWFDYKLKAKLPTIEGLARFLKIDKTTIYEWEKIHPKFSHVISDLRSEQADRLINNGLSGDYNSTIAKVLLTKHGYRDAIDTDHTTLGGPMNKTMDPTNPEIMAKLADLQKTLENNL